jgi:hypothetical protein
MHTEYEARFLAVDTDAIHDKLQALSATSTMPRTLMRRIVFKNNDIEQRGGWLRLRDEGHRITLTYKQTTNETSAIDTTLEAVTRVARQIQVACSSSNARRQKVCCLEQNVLRGIGDPRFLAALPRRGREHTFARMLVPAGQSVPTVQESGPCTPQ